MPAAKRCLINYQIQQLNSIIATSKYLELFFENLLLGKNNELKNKYLHIDFKSAEIDASKCNNCTLDELAVLNAIAKKSINNSKSISRKSKQYRTNNQKTNC